MSRPNEQLVRLAQEGMHLFPLRPGTKEPYFSWPKAATTDLVQLEAWATEYPNCNWACATGPLSGVFVIDVDPEGRNSLKLLIGEYGEDWTRTRITRTPRDGFHLWYLWNNEYPVGSYTNLLSGIDTRGHGGYVVIPPSIVTNGSGGLKSYRWAGKGLDTPIVEDSHHLAYGWSKERARQPVVVPENGRIPCKTRNETLFRLGASMRNEGFSAEAIEGALRIVNSQQCDPPLPEREIHKIAESAARYEPEAIIRLATKPTETSLDDLFLPVSEALSRSQPEIDWLIEDLIPAGCNLALAGKIKQGKTTLILDWTRQLISGEEWSGRTASQTGVVYLTEQPAASFNEEVRTAGINSDRMFVLYRPETLAHPWPMIAAQAIALATRERCRLIVIDTLTRWTNISGEGENAASIVNIMAPWDGAPAAGISVLYVFHSPKTAVEIEDSIRGSSALGGAVDVIYRLRRPEGKQEERYRMLESVGRIHGIPEKLVLNFENNCYLVSGTEEAVRLTAVERELDRLPGTPEEAIPLEHIARISGASRKTVRRAIEKREQACPETVRRIGDGTRGGPYRFYQPSVSGQSPICRGSSMYAQKEREEEASGNNEVREGSQAFPGKHPGTQEADKTGFAQKDVDDIFLPEPEPDQEVDDAWTRTPNMGPSTLAILAKRQRGGAHGK